MNRLYLYVFVFFCLTKIFSQEDPYPYGKVFREEIALKRYEKDTTAGAIVLYERGDAVIKKNQYDEMRLTYTYRARVKIFKKMAFDKADYRIPLAKSIASSKEKEKLIYAKAVSFNQDEAPMVLKQGDIHAENYDEYRDYVNFTIPNIAEGTVFDVEYQTESPFLFNFQEWKFQDDIPKAYSEYYTSIPGNYKYNVKLIGHLKLTKHVTNVQRNCFNTYLGTADCEQNAYIMTDIPAFVEEEYMTSKNNYLSKITFELREYQSFSGARENFSKSWEAVDRELRMESEIGRQSKKEGSFKEWIPAEITALATPAEKAKAIYRYLQNRMVWNGKYRLFQDIDVKKAFEERTGNVAELNLILLNMLRAAGLEANFILLSTRDNGIIFPDLYPVLSEFNYLVVKLDLDGKSYLLDSTDKYLPFGMLPFRALNETGRVIDFKKESYWYPLTESKVSLHTNYVQYSVSATGQVSATTMDTYTGYLATQKREFLAGKSEESYLETLENSLSRKGTEVELSDYKVVNKEDNEAVLKETFKINFPENATEKFIYLYPFLSKDHSENPFKLEKRSYPVDFGYTFRYSYQTTVKVDPLYEITSVPENKNLVLGNEFAVLNLTSYTSDNQLSLILNFSINKPTFTPEEYPELKNLFSELIAIQSNLPVVLKKK